MNIYTILATANSVQEIGEGRVLLTLFLLGAFLFGCVVVYCLPGVIASKRSHPNRTAIWLLTVFFGWSFFGWIGSLVWAVMPIERK